MEKKKIKKKIKKMQVIEEGEEYIDKKKDFL